MTTSNPKTLTLATATLAGRTRLLLASYVAPAACGVLPYPETPAACEPYVRATIALARTLARPGFETLAECDARLTLAGAAAQFRPALRLSMLSALRTA